MSDQNVAIARDVIDAVFSRRDFDAAAARLHPGAEWHNTGAFPGSQTCAGREAVVAFWQSFLDVFEHLGVSAVEDHAVSGDTVVVQVHSYGTTSRSGVPIDRRWAVTFRFEGHLIVRADVRGDYAKALADAGLGETSA